jgi:hypothetical protein
VSNLVECQTSNLSNLSNLTSDNHVKLKIKDVKPEPNLSNLESVFFKPSESVKPLILEFDEDLTFSSFVSTDILELDELESFSEIDDGITEIFQDTEINPYYSSQKLLQLQTQLNNKDKEIQELKEKLLKLQTNNSSPIQNTTKAENISKNQENVKAKQLLSLKTEIVIKEEPKIIQPELLPPKQEINTNLGYDNEAQKQEFINLLNST